ncbi:hypothetical protein EVJ58_g1082 [Rhodofomes roseus]|uniref:Uncharacterized protein n=1 Tax=Rhodofomes roseus TaxID=34475 RepID=A0A4Y9Z0E7_9APHY|nr:hypothetical protein EVJ58_g1082 [Rhodofomes roseus]
MPVILAVGTSLLPPECLLIPAACAARAHTSLARHSLERDDAPVFNVAIAS